MLKKIFIDGEIILIYGWIRIIKFNLILLETLWKTLFKQQIIINKIKYTKQNLWSEKWNEIGNINWYITLWIIL